MHMKSDGALLELTLMGLVLAAALGACGVEEGDIDTPQERGSGAVAPIATPQQHDATGPTPDQA
jgi:hypothetical protein